MPVLFRRMAFTFSFMIALTMAASAWAMSLQTAKQRGLVGETTTGYIAAIGPADAELNTLVNTINAKRKDAYMAISKENGQPLNVVEKLAAEKLYSRLRYGEYYLKPDGSWAQQR